MAEPTILTVQPSSIQDELATISERNSTSSGNRLHLNQTAQPQHFQIYQRLEERYVDSQTPESEDEEEEDDDRAGNDEEDDDEDEEEEEEEEEEKEIVDEIVAEDMRKLEDSFRGISRRFRLINRIGEGTFSTVYKARDFSDGPGVYDAEFEEAEAIANSHAAKRRRVGDHGTSRSEGRRRKQRPRYVALKKIYVTSSPMRIQNELELLTELRGYKSVCPLLTAFRNQDQVVAVLPFYPHTDFRLLYRTFLVDDMRHYFKSLLGALHAVHKTGIIHRDIKPTNFLYNPELRRGVLVDFGLAERAYPMSSEVCPCHYRDAESISNKLSMAKHQLPSVGYPKHDSRPPRRANRAGTRGFRAPEVLFKCTSQTTKIDMWSTGVILLTFLARRFPFFNSMDDVEAMIEIATIFGTKRMKAAALLHGQIFETNIPTIGKGGYSLMKIVKWAYCSESDPTPAETQAIEFLGELMELDPNKRLSAKQALSHPFFTNPVMEDMHPWERARLTKEEEERKASESTHHEEAQAYEEDEEEGEEEEGEGDEDGTTSVRYD